MTGFERELQQTQLDLPRAALYFAQSIAYPQLDVEAYMRHLDDMAEAARATVYPDDPPLTQTELLAEFLFQQLSFQGNHLEYDDPRNSYLNEVLDRRLGIPITLSLVFVSVAQRIGLPAYGIGLPGHFIVGVRLPEQPLYLDPFHGGMPLTEADCAGLVQRSTGFRGAFQSEWLRPAPARETLARMLNNLRQVYLERNQWAQAQQVIEHLLQLQPEMVGYLRDLGALHQQQGNLRQAVNYYERYLRRAGKTADVDAVTIRLQQATRELGRLN